TIPIVMSAGDPIGSGIVAGLARPGGNITGMSVQMAEQEGKRLELLKKLLPHCSRVAVLSNPSNPYCAIAVGEARRGATALNLQFDLMEASDARSLDAAFLTLSRIRPDAVLVVADPFLAGERVRIADEMIKNKLPSIYSYHEHVRAGGLMTYTTNYYDVRTPASPRGRGAAATCDGHHRVRRWRDPELRRPTEDHDEWTKRSATGASTPVRSSASMSASPRPHRAFATAGAPSSQPGTPRWG